MEKGKKKALRQEKHLTCTKSIVGVGGHSKLGKVKYRQIPSLSLIKKNKQVNKASIFGGTTVVLTTEP